MIIQIVAPDWFNIPLALMLILVNLYLVVLLIERYKYAKETRK